MKKEIRYEIISNVLWAIATGRPLLKKTWVVMKIEDEYRAIPQKTFNDFEDAWDFVRSKEE